MHVALVDYLWASDTSEQAHALNKLSNVCVHGAFPPPSQEALACGPIAAHVAIHAYSGHVQWDRVEAQMAELVQNQQRAWVIAINQFVDELREKEGHPSLTSRGAHVAWTSNSTASQFVPDTYLIHFVVSQLEDTHPLFKGGLASPCPPVLCQYLSFVAGKSHTRRPGGLVVTGWEGAVRAMQSQPACVDCQALIVFLPSHVHMHL